mmetsp:Transcript_4032/g.6043  ORF Transcript_4032/g.6043 Transcript_4032/m.6043 type:complete len:211 (+) Transcript_4032:2553-3185(+)
MDNLYADGLRPGLQQSGPDQYLHSESNELVKKTSCLSGDEDIINMKVRTSEIHQIYNSGHHTGGSKHLNKAAYSKEKIRRVPFADRKYFMDIREHNQSAVTLIRGGSEIKPIKVLGLPSGSMSPSNDKRQSQKFLINRISQKKQERRLVYFNEKSQSRLQNSAQQLSVFKQQYSGSQGGADSQRLLSGMKPRLTSIGDLRKMEGYNVKLS